MKYSLPVGRLAVVFVLCIVGTWVAAVAQDGSTTTRRPQRNTPQQQDPANNGQQLRDTLVQPSADPDIIRDTLSRSSGPVDTAITYYARDSVSYSIRERKLRLVGDARVSYHDQQLEAAVIEIFFDSSLMVATSSRDSTGRVSGVPKFTDKGESFYGERLVYNFRTKRGTITMGETKVDDGFYFGEKIKRVDENTLFIKDGCFTTCDHPHPHYYFKSPNMKVIANERVFVDPLVMYVEDLPVFAYPFGLFLENKRGRRSGLVIPRFFFSGAPGSFGRGIVFERLGYYWAVSDYFDTQFLTDFSTKGGFTLYNSSKYVVRDELTSSLALSYGRSRFSTEDEMETNWKLEAQHNHTISPYTRVSGNVNFSSRDYNRRTQTDLRQRIQQNILSSASFQHTFDDGSLFSVSYSRNQNIINNQMTETLPSLSYSIPSLYPLKSLVGNDSWIGNIAFSYGLSGARTYRRPGDDDTVSKRDVSMRISHSPSITISPKLGYFTVSPQISYRESWYFRKQTLTPDLSDSSIDRSFENGFFREYQYDLGLRVSTTLYGIVQPRLLGLNAVRHTFTPEISYTFTPNFAKSSYGFYNTYVDPVSNKEVQYSVFSADGGGVNNVLQQRIGFSLGNNIEAKLASGVDTIPDKTVQLLNFGINGGYNFAADSLAWSPLFVNARTSAGGILSLSGNATFNLYDIDRIVRYTASGDSIVSYTTVDRLLLTNKGGFARLTNASFTLQTSFSSQGMSSSIPNAPPPGLPDSVDYGSRFTQRLDTSYVPDDMFGDSSPGYSPLNIPWSLSLFFNMSYNEISPENISRTAALGASFSFDLTSTWHVNSSFDYNFISGAINVPSVGITKDLHCWEFSMMWYPIGLSRGFTMRLNVKSAALQDLKVEKTDNVLYD